MAMLKLILTVNRFFDGSITSGTNKCAHLSYYRADNGDPIVLN